MTTNWHSASNVSGFGTPGYENSPYSEDLSLGGSLTISPDVVTPGYDGINDHASIHYELEKPGYMATIMIFNASGQLCRQLVNNEMLGTSGSFSWDGINLSNTRAAPGIYIILAELIHPGGDVLRLKKTLVVGI